MTISTEVAKVLHTIVDAIHFREENDLKNLHAAVDDVTARPAPTPEEGSEVTVND